jgi:hypothetical protein
MPYSEEQRKLTRKRPNPEFPDYGFLGELPNEGGSSTELLITIPHPTKPGYWTNTPMLFPGQQATNTIPGAEGMPSSREQYKRAEEFAKVLQESGYNLPAFKTVDEAVAQAVHRHKAIEARPSTYPEPVQQEMYMRQMQGGK